MIDWVDIEEDDKHPFECLVTVKFGNDKLNLSSTVYLAYEREYEWYAICTDKPISEALPNARVTHWAPKPEPAK